MARFLKVLKDPVHDEILVDDPWIWDIVNTAAVQRLRRIRQLGTSYFTFHGAEHSRFTHSLGAYETMRKTLEHLYREYGWPEERERRLALAAALLHDVGHGPFSHTFEAVYPIHHETWTQRIILEDEELNSVLSEIDTDFPQDLVNVFRHGERSSVIRQLISSQLDVDRMDYLLRDAMMTGVSYGRFELTRLIRSLAMVDNQIVLKASGIHTAEQYIFARYFMYIQVYLHPVTVGSDLLVKNILQRAQELFQQEYPLEIPRSLRTLFVTAAQDDAPSVKDYMAVDEATLTYAFHCFSDTQDQVLSDLSRRFLHRQLFAAVVRPELSGEEWSYLRTLARSSGFNPDYYVLGRNTSVAGYVYTGEGIAVADSAGELHELTRMSKIVRSLVPNSEHRVYLPKELTEGKSPECQRIRTILAL
ncbi:HD domain-containing protein [Alicyclobacillus sp. SO9]|uniref:HD domain-containing protein n=1 Tax=Alicyclobacillus sp. SO9 TaxID=2665646 RepID=UPI0018E7CFB7|nr:HD domain-containing protein [Alicyclobacillus sp. SO9]QQE80377.1 HD domain-containing protein [Alicyclobacillus sp. SO9]